MVLVCCHPSTLIRDNRAQDIRGKAVDGVMGDGRQPSGRKDNVVVWCKGSTLPCHGRSKRSILLTTAKQ